MPDKSPLHLKYERSRHEYVNSLTCRLAPNVIMSIEKDRDPTHPWTSQNDSIDEIISALLLFSELFLKCLDIAFFIIAKIVETHGQPHTVL